MGILHAQSAAFKTGKALEVQYNILRELSVAFVDTVDVEKLTNIGIDAMLRSLDPYTEYIPDENEEEKEELLDNILDNLESAATLGLAEASLWLGHIYKEGLYDLETDLEQAWAWYEDGAQFRSGECYETMYAMSVQGLLHSPQEGRKIADLCAIKGARCGSRMMLRATVEAYYDGRLQGYSSEIEEYYIPVYTLLGGEEDDEDYDEDYDEDDGRYDAWS